MLFVLTVFSSDQAAEDSLIPGIITGVAVACTIIAMCITVVSYCLVRYYRRRLSSPISKRWSPPTPPTAVTRKSE